MQTQSLADYLTEEVRKAQNDQAWMYSTWKQDERDDSALGGVEVYQPSSSSIGNPFRSTATGYLSGPSVAETESWRSGFNASIKAKQKRITWLSHMRQAYTRDKQIPISLKKEPLTDVDAFIQENQIPEEQAKALQEDYDKRLESAEKLLKDQFDEANVDKLIVDLLGDFSIYGVTCGVAPLMDEYMRVTFPFFATPDPSIGLKLYLARTPKAKMVNPFDFILPSDADGDCQKSRFAGTRFFLTPDTLAKLKKVPGAKANEIAWFQREIENGTLPANTTDQLYISSRETLACPTGLKSGWRLFAKLSAEKLQNFGYGEIVEQCRANPLYAHVTHDEFTQYHVEAVIADNKCLFLAPLLTVGFIRPLFYSRRLPLRGTNYGYSIYSQCRPVTIEMTKVLRRAIDNEQLAGSMIGVLHPSVDANSATFTPGALWKVKGTASDLMDEMGVDTSKLFNQIRLQSVSQYLLQIFNLFDILLDEISLVPRNMAGFSSGQQTAFEIGENMSSAQAILLEQVQRFDTEIVAAIGRAFYYRNQIDPDIPVSSKADGSINVLGVETFSQNVLHRQKLQEFMQFASVLPDDIKRQINWQSIFTSMVSAMGLDSKEVVTDTQTVIAQLTEQVQQLQEENAKVQEAYDKLEKENRNTMMESEIVKRTLAVRANLTKAEVENKALTKVSESRKRVIDELVNRNSKLSEMGEREDERPAGGKKADRGNDRARGSIGGEVPPI